MSTDLVTETAITVERANLAHLTVRGEASAPLIETRREREARPTRQSVRTAVVDEDAFFRNGIVRVLARTSCEVIANCAGPAELSTEAVRNAQLVIFGIHEYSRSTHDKIQSMRRSNQQFQIITLGERVKTEKLLNLISGGINCYLVKDGLTPQILTKSIELVLLGAVVFTDCFHVDLRKSGRSTQDDDFLSIGARPAGADEDEIIEGQGNQKWLSKRERAILSLLMKGAANKDIALHLGITEPTVKIHVKNLLIKSGAQNRTQAALWGWKSRIEETY